MLANQSVFHFLSTGTFKMQKSLARLLYAQEDSKQYDTA
jgi:hypothetical protein